MQDDLPVYLPADSWGLSHDSGVGIDTIAVVGPTTEAMMVELRHHHISQMVDLTTGELSETRHGSGYFNVGHAAAFVACRRRPGGDAGFKMELSLPRMLYGHNRDPLVASQLTDAVDAAVGLLAEQLPDVPGLNQLHVQRLDLARDFRGLTSPTSTLSALSRRKIPYAQHYANYPRTDATTLQTIERGSKSTYMLRWYDKGHQLAHAASVARSVREQALLRAWAEVSQDRLRYETELRPRALRKAGIVMVRDCTPEAVGTIARGYFDRSGWSTPYGGSRVDRALAELSGELSTADYNNLLAFLHATEHGLPCRLNRHALDRVRPIVRRHSLLDLSDGEPQRRLDFAAGEEVSDES